MFIVLAIVYVAFQMKAVASGVTQGPGQTVGIDVNVLANWTVRSPMFWIAFVVMAAIGSTIVRYWKH
jgi:hypothetical protein